MDILAHGLWVGAGLAAWRRRRRGDIGPRTIAWTLVLAAVPDLAHALPVAMWALGSGSWADWLAYVVATPQDEPPIPLGTALWSHHLHCVGHSAFAAAAATAFCWGLLRRFWLPLLGWWSHIVIDVFAHSSEFYPSPVFYPLTYWGFDGIAWNEPWFIVINYTALLAVGLVLWLTRERADKRQR